MTYFTEDRPARPILPHLPVLNWERIRGAIAGLAAPKAGVSPKTGSSGGLDGLNSGHRYDRALDAVELSRLTNGCLR